MHRATLPNEVDVVVKVQRLGAAPGRVRPQADGLGGARGARGACVRLDFIDTNELVDEFARSIRLELDYQQEARNAETFRRNFAGDDQLQCRACGGGTRRGGS